MTMSYCKIRGRTNQPTNSSDFSVTSPPKRNKRRSVFYVSESIMFLVRFAIGHWPMQIVFFCILMVTFFISVCCRSISVVFGEYTLRCTLISSKNSHNQMKFSALYARSPTIVQPRVIHTLRVA